jgi:hypothetical protein
METITITLKSKKARRLIESLEALDVIRIESSAEPSKKEVDLNWLPSGKRKHAAEIVSAYREAKHALDTKLPLKSAKDLLNEL